MLSQRPTLPATLISARVARSGSLRANLLGSSELFLGDYKKAFTIDKDYEAVTAADIQRVAKKYFTEKNRTVATLIPEGKSK